MQVLSCALVTTELLLLRAEPGSWRQGRTLVGYGLASTIRMNVVVPSETRIRLDSKGMLTAWADMTDIGTGTYAILTQIAADMLGLTAEQVETRLGDSDFPRGSGSGGSFGASSAGSAKFLTRTETLTA